MNIFEVLRGDHDKQRELIHELTATSGDSKQRNELFLSIKKQLDAHAIAEERYLYAPMMVYDLSSGKGATRCR